MQPVNWTPQGLRTRVFDWPCNAFPRGQSTSNALVHVLAPLRCFGSSQTARGGNFI